MPAARGGVPESLAMPLRDNQLITLLVGVAMEVSRQHRVGQTFGSIHPPHIDLDRSGRPVLRNVPTTPGWSKRDDVRSVLRLGGAMAAHDSRLAPLLRERAAESAEDECIEQLIWWLMSLGSPEPLLCLPSWSEFPNP